MIRITRLKLENFIGIWEGTGKETIEINFGESSKNKITILAGNNGSGKTTILSTLHPHLNNGDERRDIIIPGKEGLKEIDYLKDGVKYTIQHHYGLKSNKSYIQKDGEELNPNGGVRSFNDIVSEELGFDNTYFRIGRIGDNNENFIDMTATARKNFIFKNFLPNVDEYLSSFNGINELHRDLKGNIKFLTDEISKIGDVDELKQELVNVEELYNRVSKRRDELSNEVIKHETLYNSKRQEIINYIKDSLDLDLDSNLSLGNTIIQVNEYIDDKMDYFKKELSLGEELSQVVQELKEYTGKDMDYSDGGNIKDSLLDIKNKVYQLEVNLKTYNEELSRLSDSKRKLMSEKQNSLDAIDKIKDESSSLELGSLEDVENTISSYSSNLSELKGNETEIYSKLIKYFDEKTIDLLNKEKSLVNVYISDIINGYLNDYHEFGSFIQTLRDKSPKEDMTLEELLNYKDWMFNGLTLGDINKAIEETRNYMYKLELESDELERKNKESDILKLRPDACTIDSCSFIANALKNKEEYEERSPIITSELKSKQDNIHDLKKVKEEMEYMQSLDNSTKVVEIYNRLSERNPVYKALLPHYKDIETYKGNIHYKAILGEINRYVNTLNNIESYSSNIDRLKSSISEIKSTEKLIAVHNERVDEVDKELSELLELLNDNEKKITSITLSISRLKDLQEKVSGYLDFITKKDEFAVQEERFNVIKSTLDSKVTEIVELTKIKKSVEEALAIEIDNLKIHENKKSDIDIRMARLMDYQEKKSSLDETFDKVTLIHDALNPKTGIPVVLIGEYLDETAKIANELLDISQGGDFKLKFEVNEKEFKIPVSTGDLVQKEDITLASQGQKALAKVSLSFALIQQSLSDYNILMLDEMDSTLDDTNSKYYIDMLTRQISELGSDQVFIISHNREFDSQPVDLVLLKDHGLDLSNESFMEGKEVIFNLYD